MEQYVLDIKRKWMLWAPIGGMCRARKAQSTALASAGRRANAQELRTVNTYDRSLESEWSKWGLVLFRYNVCPQMLMG